MEKFSEKIYVVIIYHQNINKIDQEVDDLNEPNKKYPNLSWRNDSAVDSIGYSSCMFFPSCLPLSYPLLSGYSSYFLLGPFCPIKANLILFCIHSMTFQSIRHVHSITLFSNLASTLHQFNYMKQKIQIYDPHMIKSI
jgi:hypothetical protein